MSRSKQYEELEEMSISVSDAKKAEIEDDIKVGKEPKQKKRKPGEKQKTPYQLQKEAEQRRARNKMIIIIVAVFLAVLAALVAVGVAFSSDEVQKSERDESRGYFLNTKNLPEMDPIGVRGMIKEAYFTKNGNLALTLNLSNGTGSEHEIVRVNATVVNDKGETVAKQTLEDADFPKRYKVPAGGRGEMYFEIDEECVLLPEDTLYSLGSTLEIGSKPTDGKMPTTQPKGAVVGDGPKDVAKNRKFYENLGNMPGFSADGLQATIVRARYTNDGSLVLDFSVSNGTDNDQYIDTLNVMMKNAAGELITEHAFTGLAAQKHTVAAQSYGEIQLIVDAAHVQIRDDSLETLTTSITATGAVVS